MADNYGILLNNDILLHRQYFIEMCRLIGINVIYKKPIKDDKYYDQYSELHSKYEPNKVIGCIFEDHPTQQTLKKLGWVHELQENASIIHVPYDLDGLQQGALFIIPSAYDKTQGRVFRVVKMSANMIYPASIACEIVPEYENDFEPDLFDHTRNNFSVLAEEEE